MTRQEYADRVVACLRGPTKDETEAIRAELDAHIEDHICDLLDLGYEEELAEERTMMFMGNPEEVAKELDKQYPLRWLVIGDLAVGVSVFLGFLLVLLLTVGEPNIVKALRCRWQPEPVDCLETVEVEEDIDLRGSIGNDIIRVYRVDVGELDGQRMAMVNVDTFDCLPLGAAAQWTEYAVLENQRGETGQGYWEDGLRSRYYGNWCRHACLGVPVELEDTYVTLRCERFGQTTELRVPLPKEGTP